MPEAMSAIIKKALGLMIISTFLKGRIPRKHGRGKASSIRLSILLQQIDDIVRVLLFGF